MKAQKKVQDRNLSSIYEKPQTKNFSNKYIWVSLKRYGNVFNKKEIKMIISGGTKSIGKLSSPHASPVGLLDETPNW